MKLPTENEDDEVMTEMKQTLTALLRVTPDVDLVFLLDEILGSFLHQ